MNRRMQIPDVADERFPPTTEDFAGEAYMGQPVEGFWKRGETRSVAVRIPEDIHHAILQIINDPRWGYDANMGNFVRYWVIRGIVAHAQHDGDFETMAVYHRMSRAARRQQMRRLGQEVKNYVQALAEELQEYRESHMHESVAAGLERAMDLMASFPEGNDAAALLGQAIRREPEMNRSMIVLMTAWSDSADMLPRLNRLQDWWVEVNNATL